MMPGALKARLIVAEYGWPVVAVLALVGVCCLAGAGWVVATPPTEEYTARTDEQTFASEVHTSALVANGSSLWQQRDRIEDAPVYVLSAAPDLTLTQTLDVPDDRPVDVTRTITLEYRAQRDGRTFWRTHQTPVESTRTIVDGEATNDTTLNVTRIRNRRDEIEATLGDAGTIQPTLAINVTYETANYSGVLDASAPLRIESNTYTIAGSLDANRTRTTPVTRTRTGSADPLVYGPLGLLGLGSLAIAAVAGTWLRRGIDATVVRRRIHEQRYAEWLSAGTIPEPSGGSVVWMDSLEDLVDVAIDIEKRAIHDRSRGRYAVLDGDVRYCYAPKTAETDTTDDS